MCVWTAPYVPIGFRDAAFEKTVGKARYRWMQSLGNRGIRRRGRRMQIDDPEAVEELLGLALARRKRRQRVIFFCQCSFPGSPGKVNCHRLKVASLLLQAARKRNVDLTIVEWPGGHPKSIPLRLTDEVAESVLRGRANLPLGPRRPATDLLGLPWRSVVQLNSPNHRFRALADHARFQSGRWVLPLPFRAAERTANIISVLQLNPRIAYSRG
jgi:hypothetical protein